MDGLTPYPGSCPVISWNSTGTTGKADAILWILVTAGFQTGTGTGSTMASAVGLYAYKAAPDSSHKLGIPLFTDAMNGPGTTKFMVPTVVNGVVYIAGQHPGMTCADAYDSTGYKGQVVSWYHH
jgi:hypothetical protein